MGFFEFLLDVKDNIDRSKEAKEYIQKAKVLIREGNDIYEKAYDRVNLYASETEYEICEHNKYKQAIAKELGNTISDTIKNFEHFNIDSKIISPVITYETKDINTGVNVFKSFLSKDIMPRHDTMSLFDLFISDEDYYEAQMKYFEAESYKTNMELEREQLNNYKERMSEIRAFIRAEQKELESLMQKLRKIVNELNNNMQKECFYNAEAEYLKGIHGIADCIISLLSTEFLNDTLYITQKYERLFCDIKKINQTIPSEPDISATNIIAVLKDILTSGIVT